MAQDTLESFGEKTRRSLYKSSRSSSSGSSSTGILLADTIDDDLSEVLLLPLLLLRSDIGDIQEDRPERDEIPESE